ncbi:MAG: hypothetical protein IJ287_02200 [Methanobrevibacter sp.]|nr:hypothetical protein [Methanobrevibacter sp.]
MDMINIAVVKATNINEVWLNATSETKFCPTSPPAKAEVITTRTEEPIDPAISLEVLYTVDASSLLSETMDIAQVEIGMNNNPKPT